MSAIAAVPSTALEIMRSRAQARSLREATDRLVSDYDDRRTTAEVLAAVAGARARARVIYSRQDVAPTPGEYAALIEALVRAELDARR